MLLPDMRQLLVPVSLTFPLGRKLTGHVKECSEGWNPRSRPMAFWRTTTLQSVGFQDAQKIETES
jgi:hypothetical protein